MRTYDSYSKSNKLEDDYNKALEKRPLIRYPDGSSAVGYTSPANEKKIAAIQRNYDVETHRFWQRYHQTERTGSKLKNKKQVDDKMKATVKTKKSKSKNAKLSSFDAETKPARKNLVSETRVTTKVKTVSRREYLSPRGRAESANHSRDVKRDNQRVALPPGRRVSSSGNVYYERRENRADLAEDRRTAQQYRQSKSNERQIKTINAAAKKSKSRPSKKGKGKKGKNGKS